MRIAILPSSFWPAFGGVEELTHRLAAALQDAGDAVEIWAPADPRQPAARREIWDGLTVRRFAMPFPPSQPYAVARAAPVALEALHEMRHAVKEFSPDLLHVQCFGPNGAYATALSVLSGVPLVVTLQGETVMDDNDIYKHSNALRAALRLGLLRARVVSACSNFTLDDARRFGLRPHRARVIYNGVLLQEPQGYAEGQQGLQPAPLPERYVLALGRVVEKKGFDLLVRAFSRLEDADDVHLVIGGDGPALSSLRHIVAGLRLTGRVHFPGRLARQQVVKLMKAAEVFVMPSRVEPFGIVVLEAWREGTPVVATNIGGPQEFVTHGVDGLLADPFDTEELASAISELLHDSACRNKLGHNGKQKVAQFTWPAIARQYRDFYRAALQASRSL